MTAGVHTIVIHTKHSGYSRRYVTAIVYTDGSEKVIYDGPSYIDASRATTGLPYA